MGQHEEDEAQFIGVDFTNETEQEVKTILVSIPPKLEKDVDELIKNYIDENNINLYLKYCSNKTPQQLDQEAEYLEKKCSQLKQKYQEMNDWIRLQELEAERKNLRIKLGLEK